MSRLRSARVTVRLRPAELRILERVCDATDLNLAEYVRAAVLTDAQGRLGENAPLRDVIPAAE